jgi:hypothetical protein
MPTPRVNFFSVHTLLGHANVQTSVHYDRRSAWAKKKAVGTLHVPYQRQTSCGAVHNTDGVQMHTPCGDAGQEYCRRQERKDTGSLEWRATWHTQMIGQHAPQHPQGPPGSRKHARVPYAPHRLRLRRAAPLPPGSVPPIQKRHDVGVQLGHNARLAAVVLPAVDTSAYDLSLPRWLAVTEQACVGERTSMWGVRASAVGRHTTSEHAAGVSPVRSYCSLGCAPPLQ